MREEVRSKEEEEVSSTNKVIFVTAVQLLKISPFLVTPQDTKRMKAFEKQKTKQQVSSEHMNPVYIIVLTLLVRRAYTCISARNYFLSPRRAYISARVRASMLNAAFSYFSKF